VRVAMGIMGYGGNEWFRGRHPPRAPAPRTVTPADRRDS